MERALDSSSSSGREGCRLLSVDYSIGMDSSWTKKKDTNRKESSSRHVLIEQDIFDKRRIRQWLCTGRSYIWKENERIHRCKRSEANKNRKAKHLIESVAVFIDPWWRKRTTASTHPARYRLPFDWRRSTVFEWLTFEGKLGPFLLRGHNHVA